MWKEDSMPNIDSYTWGNHAYTCILEIIPKCQHAMQRIDPWLDFLIPLFGRDK